MAQDDKFHKSEMVMTSAQAADFLRRLADQLEKSDLDVSGVHVETDGLIKIKQSLKTKPEGVSFKLKLKYQTGALAGHEDAAWEADEDEGVILPPSAAAPAPDKAGEEEPEKPGRPGYKKLKKRLGGSFKSLGSALDKGEAPPAELVRAVVDDCLLSCTYPGKGDEFYGPWTAMANKLAAAGEAGDQAAMRALVQELKDLKKACHEKFK